jgi:NAD(P)-dependent dehydrogenase (short-subunit alcohol dehydrogenase family)
VNSILVLGGYGGFGARISRRLAAAGYRVLVAGRSMDKARAFCARDPALVPLPLDRADIAAALISEKPDLVVDASGPFQAMDYAVPRACIAARIPYCDIADGRDFVCGISVLNDAARAAGVVVIAGASSVPALSGAVVRHLADGLDRVRAVEMAISASNRATAGPAVAASILGQVGQPVRLFRGGRIVETRGWQELERLDFAMPGTKPITGRLAAIADVPDLALLPDRLMGRPAVVFRAGTELGWQNRFLWAMVWPVRWGLVAGLSRFSHWLLPMQNLTRKLGSDRSAMMVRLFGDRAAARIERRWTLIADGGDGPEIPTLAIPVLAARILAGKEPPGARDAGLALGLLEYEPAFAGLAIKHHVEEVNAAPSLYRRIMGSDYDALPPSLRAMHDIFRDGGAAGEAEVFGASNGLGRIVARMMQFPPPGKHALHVWFRERDGGETWTRNFGGQCFSSRLSQSGNRLVEKFGPLRFFFELSRTAEGLRMDMRGWSFLGLPLPLAMAPRSDAREFERQGRFHFDVPIVMPLIGTVVHYRGWLEPV